MAGNGRRAAVIPTSRLTLRADGKIGGFDLPEGMLPKGEEWHPMTVVWWEEWRRSPQAAAMATEVDWHYLLATALLHHQYWKNGRWELANEIRMREAKLGATPADRRALRFEIEILEEHPVGVPGGNVTQMSDERRKRIANG